MLLVINVDKALDFYVQQLNISLQGPAFCRPCFWQRSAHCVVSYEDAGVYDILCIFECRAANFFFWLYIYIHI